MRVKKLKFHLLLAICAIVLLAGCGRSKEELKLAEEVKAKTSENARLVQELQATKAENAKVVEQVRIASSENDRLTNQLKAATSENANLTDQLKTARSDLIDVTARARKLEDELLGIAKAKKQEEIEQANRAKLTVQAGVTMQSGETKPVANVEIFITVKSLDEIMPFADLMVEDLWGDSQKNFVHSTAHAWGKSAGRSSTLYATVPAQVEPRLQRAKITSTRTDFNGIAEFPELMPGAYFIHCATALGGGAAWSLKFELKPGQNKLFLSNNNLSN